MTKFALISDPQITSPNPQTGWMVPAVATEPTSDRPPTDNELTIRLR